jgi:glutamate dehydrogenase (NADP+)
VYTNAMIMGWMMDEFSKLSGQRTPAVITGKPIPLGGSLGRDDATGRGAYYCIKELEIRNGWTPSEMRVAVQGFGNAGQSVAQLLYADGYKIVAVSDSQGGIHNEEGFDIPSLAYMKNESRRLEAVYCNGSLCETIDATRVTNEELLKLDVDILIPAAMENQITVENADQIKASVIVEVANGPITSQADEILNKDGKMVVPDILANAGGVTVSYFEWVQNKAGYYWPLDEVHSKLRAIMTREFGNTYELMQEFDCDMRTAAYVLALTRINEAISAHGTDRYFSGND